MGVLRRRNLLASLGCSGSRIALRDVGYVAQMLRGDGNTPQILLGVGNTPKYSTTTPSVQQETNDGCSGHLEFHRGTIHNVLTLPN